MVARLVPRPVLIALTACLLVSSCGDGSGSVSVDTTVDTTVEAPPVGEPPAEDASSPERRMERLVFELVNEERRARGLEPLEWDERLAEAARSWSSRMAERGSLEHQDADELLERAHGLVGVGENIFRGSGPIPASTVHVGWMRSDGHRANVLRPGFDRLGVGFVCTDDGQVFATQRFGRTGPPPTAAPDREVPPAEPIVAEEGRGPSCGEAVPDS